MPNYKYGKIYKLIDNTNGNVYYGSTTENTLSRRLSGHIGSYHRYLNSTGTYTSSFEILKNNDYKIVLVELFSCTCKDELTMREQYYIDNFKCVNKANAKGSTLTFLYCPTQFVPLITNQNNTSIIKSSSMCLESKNNLIVNYSMNPFIKSLEEKLIENRPNLKASSIKTYISCLSNLVKKMDGELTIEFFNNPEPILKYLEDKTPAQRKTTLSSLFILTKHQDYQKPMLEDIKTVNDDYKEQKKNIKETENWVSQEELQKIFDEHHNNAMNILKKKVWNAFDISELQKFFILVFLGGFYFPPRRSQDYTELKIKNFEKNTDNYISKGFMYFNVYKTFKTYGEQKVEIPSHIDKMIKKYIKHIENVNEYFFFNPKTNNKFTSPNITIMINSIFEKKVSTNLLRHMYLSEKYKDLPHIKDMEATSTQMGHSVITCLEKYVKH